MAKKKEVETVYPPLDTWTVKARFIVFAGNMEKKEVMESAEAMLQEMTDGSDIVCPIVVDAERDVI